MNAMATATAPAPRWQRDAAIAAIWGGLAGLSAVAVLPYLLQLSPGLADKITIPFPVFAAIQGVQAFALMGLLAFGDELKPTAANAVRQLKALGIRTVLVTGDNQGSAQAVLARFIADGGFARHIRRVGSVYRTRHDMITRILTRDFADHLDVIPSSAGLHVTAVSRKASAAEVHAVARRASELEVEVQELSRLSVDVPRRAGLVLGYGAIPAGRIEEGLRRLRKCFAG